MGTEFDSFPFQDHGDHILSLWLDLDDVYTPTVPQELQDLENHLFNHETEPISSFPFEESPFFHDLYNFDAAETNENYQSMVAMEPDVCETFLNDYEFGLISPNDHMSPDSINDSYCDNTTSPVMNHDDPGDVVMSQRPMVIETNANETNKSDCEENGDGTDEERKPGTLNSKNLVSERNRRKRLSQQLLSLRAIVPNITKMDKRSVLVDALSYLTNIHEETERLEKELKDQQQRPKMSELKESSHDNPSGTLRLPRTLAPVAVSKPKAQITEIDTEKIEDKRFVVKITCKGGGGGGGDIFRVFESLDFEITYTALQKLQPLEFLVTIFIRVRKQGKMTEKKLKDSITNMAHRIGLSILEP